MPTGITWHRLQPREDRWALLGQAPVIAWLTGLSGAGKSTIAAAADRTLIAGGRHSAVLDGDNLRHGLNADLAFSPEDRSENVRRTAEVARLMAEAGSIVIVSLISPYRADRALARRIAADIPFLEVFVDTPLGLCEARDPKGLYRLARAGRIEGFTGISAPYEAPERPDLTIPTQDRATEDSALALSRLLLRLSRPMEGRTPKPRR
ncbi:adenylyl-sulfate kinase [Methylobacterium sp. NEAU K]|uniref:adenylyl-sulfate kinase n=1 Tax=Methylobacterium sp. NEAU K TaxID=3064946 RepID=UPI0027323EA3|nr:adenylyl-sulfate kinase [Methylobacterium sp. NEAU K]MDP4003763.1 adenylyl-sulfate kinase [Methylobacterium sp. NEAU K]